MFQNVSGVAETRNDKRTNTIEMSIVKKKKKKMRPRFDVSSVSVQCSFPAIVLICSIVLAIPINFFFTFVNVISSVIVTFLPLPIPSFILPTLFPFLSGLLFVLSGRGGRGHAKQEDLPLPEEDQASETCIYRDRLKGGP